MAATSKLVHVRPNPRLNTVRLFSSSTSSTPTPPPDSADKPPEPDSRSQFSSYFSDVKATLKQTQQMNPSPRPAPSRPFNFPPPNPSMSPPPPKLTSLEETGKMVSVFRHPTVPSTPGSQPPSPASHISFQDILQKNVNSRSQGSSLNDEKPGSNYAFSSIRESLKQIKLPTEKNPNLNKSLSEYQQSFKLRISNDPGGIDSHILTSGTDSLPFPVFTKEMAYAEDNEAKKTELVKYYSVKELGEKLKSLRPEKKGDKKDWFSLDELNERLVKLRQMELEMDKGNESKNTAAHFRNALSKMKQDNHDKTKNLSSKLGKTSFHKNV